MLREKKTIGAIAYTRNFNVNSLKLFLRILLQIRENDNRARSFFAIVSHKEFTIVNHTTHNCFRILRQLFDNLMKFHDRSR